jgi:hypothetical protein
MAERSNVLGSADPLSEHRPKDPGQVYGCVQTKFDFNARACLSGHLSARAEEHHHRLAIALGTLFPGRHVRAAHPRLWSVVSVIPAQFPQFGFVEKPF